MSVDANDALIFIISLVAGVLFYFAIKAGSIWVMGGALLILFIAVCVAAWFCSYREGKDDD